MGSTTIKRQPGGRRISQREAELIRRLEQTKRDRVLEAASRLFYRKGYSATTIEEISSALGMAKPYVYQYFDSKLALLEEICEVGTREVFQIVKTCVAVDGTPADRLRRLVEEFTAAALERQRYVTIYFRESMQLPRPTATRIKQARIAIDEMLTALIREGVGCGEFQAKDPHLSALTMAGMMSYTFAWYRAGSRYRKEDVCRYMAEQVLRLVGAPATRPELL
jgi:AcrR family transcriptional regulator